MSERYETKIEDGTIYVEADVGWLEIGPISDIIQHFGEKHTVEYDDWEKNRYGDEIDFDDEGMTVDVVRTVENMTHSEGCLRMLKKKSADPNEGYNVFTSPRMAVFAGFVGENLDHGVM